MFRHGDAWISTIRRLGYATSILFPAAGDWQLRATIYRGTDATTVYSSLPARRTAPRRRGSRGLSRLAPVVSKNSNEGKCFAISGLSVQVQLTISK